MAIVRVQQSESQPADLKLLPFMDQCTKGTASFDGRMKVYKRNRRVRCSDKGKLLTFAVKSAEHVFVNVGVRAFLHDVV